MGPRDPRIEEAKNRAWREIAAIDAAYARGDLDDAGWHREVTALVGCANGLLMESVARWGRERGYTIEPHGLEIAPQLAGVARSRLPHWADRIHVGNALGWRTDLRFDYVRTGLEYVPQPRRRDLVSWLLTHVVAPGGRLIVGKYNEELEQRTVEEDLRDWGFVVTARSERACKHEPRIAYRIVWIDADVA